MAKIENIASTAPAAPKRWPTAPWNQRNYKKFMELTQHALEKKWIIIHPIPSHHIQKKNNLQNGTSTPMDESLGPAFGLYSQISI